MIEALQEYISTCNVLNYVGVVTVGGTIVLAAKAFLWTPFRLYVLAQISPPTQLKKFGRWGVVTGATDGIGKLTYYLYIYLTTLGSVLYSNGKFCAVSGSMISLQ